MHRLLPALAAGLLLSPAELPDAQVRFKGHTASVRVRNLGYRAVRAKTTEEAHQILVDPRFAIGAAVIPPDMPALDLRGALRALSQLASVEELTFLVHGQRPFSQRRRELAQAGVGLALWDPVDAHTLRFQLNRVFAGNVPLRGRRRALRAPAAWRVDLRLGRRQKEARVYTISARGVYLATKAPALRGVSLDVELPLPLGTVQAAGRVAMTNVPGNLMKQILPVGMGVRFDSVSAEAEALLQVYAEERLRELARPLLHR